MTSIRSGKHIHGNRYNGDDRLCESHCDLFNIIRYLLWFSFILFGLIEIDFVRLRVFCSVFVTHFKTIVSVTKTERFFAFWI